MKKRKIEISKKSEEVQIRETDEQKIEWFLDLMETMDDDRTEKINSSDSSEHVQESEIEESSDEFSEAASESELTSEQIEAEKEQMMAALEGIF